MNRITFLWNSDVKGTDNVQVSRKSCSVILSVDKFEC